MARIYNELRNYQNIPRELVFDKTLSDRARFVYVFMACKPDGWDFFLEPMSKDIGYSVDTLRKYLNELVASGWLVKGEQSNEHGIFGAVEYTLKATKITDTENFRYGKNAAQKNIDNISLPNTKDNPIKEENNKEIKKESDELFEKCWIAYKRKGSKKKSFEYWKKLTDVEKQNVMPHIKAYVSTRELQFQKDFERYLRDKIFMTVVFGNNKVVYDPTKIGKGETVNEVYMPTCDGALSWNEYYNCYMYVGFWDGKHIPDGYDDDTRPDGASVTLNNGRGTLVWNSETKTWIKQ